MKKPNITPGPWAATNVNGTYVVRDKSGRTVSENPGVTYTDDANAQAIAALPDLLAALEGCLQSLERMPETEGAYKWTCIAQAKAALTKAGYTF